jgi:hypothetical protein
MIARPVPPGLARCLPHPVPPGSGDLLAAAGGSVPTPKRALSRGRRGPGRGPGRRLLFDCWVSTRAAGGRPLGGAVRSCDSSPLCPILPWASGPVGHPWDRVLRPFCLVPWRPNGGWTASIERPKNDTARGVASQAQNTRCRVAIWPGPLHVVGSGDFAPSTIDRPVSTFGPDSSTAPGSILHRARSAYPPRPAGCPRAPARAPSREYIERAF